MFAKALILVLLVTPLVAGCNSSSRESKSDEVGSASKSQSSNPNLLSVEGELFPLSAYYGVCVKYKGIWKADLENGMLGSHFPTGGKIVLAEAGEVTVSVGKFGMWPGTVVKDVPVASPPRRIQIARYKDNETILVSGFDKASNNLVSIDFNEADAGAESRAAIMRFANSIVACRLSASDESGR
jgi:hypothetical protein